MIHFTYESVQTALICTIRTIRGFKVQSIGFREGVMKHPQVFHNILNGGAAPIPPMNCPDKRAPIIITDCRPPPNKIASSHESDRAANFASRRHTSTKSPPAVPTNKTSLSHESDRAANFASRRHTSTKSPPAVPTNKTSLSHESDRVANFASRRHTSTKSPPAVPTNKTSLTHESDRAANFPSRRHTSTKSSPACRP